MRFSFPVAVQQMCFDVSHQGWWRAKGIKIEDGSVTAGSMTALPAEDFRAGEDLKLIPPTEYSMNEGDKVIPAASQKLLNDSALKSS